MPRVYQTDPLDLSVLRQAWVQRPEARDLLLEIHRLHRVLRDINTLRIIIEREFRESIGGQLVALHRLKGIMIDEPGVDTLYPPGVDAWDPTSNTK